MPSDQANVDPSRLLELARDLFAVAAPDGRFVYANDEWERVLGWPLDELMSKPFVEFVHPEDRERTRREAARIFSEDQEAVRFENRYLRKDGDYCWLQWTSRLDPASSHIYAVARDVTAERRMRERLETADQQFRLLAEHVEEAFWISDARKERMLYVSPAYERILGASPEPLYEDASAWLQYLHPDDRPRFDRAAARFAAEGAFDAEFRIIRPDGEERVVRDRAYPVMEGGKLVRIVGVIEDVTERRDAEQSRLRLLQNIAHDLAGPLQPLDLQVRILRRKAPEEVRKNLDILERNVAHLRRLVQDVQDVMRLERDELRLRLETTDLAALARQVAGMYDESEPPPIRVAAEDGVEANVDAHRLTRVLVNLVRNARKFTPKDGTVTVRCHQADGKARLAVQDTGRGLTEDEQQRLFQAFTQVHDTAHLEEKGTGLGLYICKGIVEAHGGRIWVESEGRGKGSTFHIALPAAGDAPA